ncbi:MAG: hypothetical protein ACXVAY_04445 [Mucilaginibacter sp.]
MKTYIVVIYDYLKSIELSQLIWNFIVCSCLAVSTFYMLYTSGDIEPAKAVINNSVSILGILVGFSISMFTLLNTAANPNIDSIKKRETGKFSFGKPIYLFDLLLVGMIYVIIGESIVLVFNLLFSFFFCLDNLTGKIAFGFDVFMITHIIFTNIKAITNFYFILSKK